MRRRTFYAALWVWLATNFAGLAVVSGQGTLDYAYALSAVAFLGLAAYYRFGSEPFDNPDAQVTRRWVGLTAVVVAALSVAGGMVLFPGVF